MLFHVISIAMLKTSRRNMNMELCLKKPYSSYSRIIIRILTPNFLSWPSYMICCPTMRDGYLFSSGCIHLCLDSLDGMDDHNPHTMF